MKKSRQSVNDIPHYDRLPFILQDYIKYKCVIENRTFETVKRYTYDICFFLKYLRKTKLNIDNMDIPDVNIEFVDEEFFQSITRSEILEYLFYLKSDRQNSTNSRYRKLEAIKSLFKYLHTENIVSEDIAAEIKLPNLETSLPKYLTKEESYRLLESVDGPDYERDLCIIEIFLNCGLRLSELVNIDIPDIKEDKLRVYGKGNKEREVVLNPICQFTIQQYLLVRCNCEKQIVHKKALFISRKTGMRLGKRRVQQIVTESLKKAGLNGYSTHKLRHTAATLAYQNGADIRVIKDFLGHENLSTTEIYTHLDFSQLKEVAYKNPLATYQPQKKSSQEKESSAAT